MEILEIYENKKEYLPLLLLADEQESMIDKYLAKGRMFILMDNGKVKAECVITDEGNSILEIKNIAVAPEEQKQGLGRKLIEFVKDKFKQEYKILQVGTGDSPLTIPFYESCGFKRSHVISDFFTKNYDHPIYEAGVLLKDMVILRMDLKF